MKKGLGLQANISSFNTTLPQTKHLNFFMGTNPVRYANGGDVRRGVPSSNMNVTQGFLPMALGFDNGGDVGVYSAVIKTIAKYLTATQNLFQGKSENDPEVIEAAENIAQNNPEIVEQITTNNGAYPVGTPSGVIEPPTPLDTAKEPDKSINLDGIKENVLGFFDKKKKDFLDEGIDGLFGEDLVDFRDNVILPKVDEGIKNLPQFLEPDSEKVEKTSPEMTPEKQSILDDLEDLMFKDDDKPSKKDKKTEDKKEDSTSNATDAVTDSPVKSGGSGVSAGAYDSGFSIPAKDAKEASKGIASITGNEGKKEIPSWALPLASAGFAMMASKSPYFLQALGEGGQEGLKTLTAQQERKEDKLDKEAERAFLKARTEQVGRPDAPFKIGNAFYKYDENNKLVKVRNIQRTLTEIEDDLRTRIFGYDNLSLAERQELIKKEQLSDQNILYQGDTTEATKDNDRNILDSIKDYIGA
jgi:hypothetical protein